MYHGAFSVFMQYLAWLAYVDTIVYTSFLVMENNMSVFLHIIVLLIIIWHILDESGDVIFYLAAYTEEFF